MLAAKLKSFHILVISLFSIACIEVISDYKILQPILFEIREWLAIDHTHDDYDGPQRIFQLWDFTKYAFPCILENDPTQFQNQKELKGLLYMKLLKTASSTLAGINIRIATNYAKRKLKSNSRCKTLHDHEWFKQVDICSRNDENSFLWTFIRDPTKRAISDFYFQVSRKGIKSDDANFKYHVRRFRMDYLKFMSCKGAKYFNFDTNETKQAIQTVINQFNFIGVTERLDESLVVLQHILDIETSDIAYISSKVNGGYDDGFSGSCIYIQQTPKELSPEMERYFQSAEWKSYNENNMALYKAVNKSLDLTIEEYIGRKKFDASFLEFQKTKDLISKRCPSSSIKFPCTTDGVLRPKEETDCYEEDLGCGYSCINTLFPDFSKIMENMVL